MKIILRDYAISMVFREIDKSDITDILDIRVSTKETHFSMTDLAEVGVTPESVAELLNGFVNGWVCEISGKPVGFALADSKTAEVLVVAYYPEFEKKGIGKALMHKLHDWLWSFDTDLSYLREFEHVTLARVLVARYKNEGKDHSIHEAMGLLGAS